MSNPEDSRLVAEAAHERGEITEGEIVSKGFLDVRESDHLTHGDPDSSGVSSVSCDEGRVTIVVAQQDDHDDEDGFKTPTSVEHKIPVLTECPPAPASRRLKSKATSGRKRRGSPRSEEDERGQVRAVNLSSDELESLFRLRPRDDAMVQSKKIKRARIDEND